MEERELEILEALDSGEITKAQADELMSRVKADAEPIKQEIHPEFALTGDNIAGALGFGEKKGIGTRFKYKNFATNPEEAMQFIQERHPDMMFKVEPGGSSILAKKKDDKEWRYVDPPSLDMQDVSDLAFDVPAGIAEGVATAGGGIAGGFMGLAGGPAAPVTVPVGALGMASATGAAAGNVVERGRQGLGRYFGVGTENQDMIDTATMFGAASPLLFGTGAAGKQALKAVGKSSFKNMGKPVQEAMAQKIAQGQSGLIGQGYNVMRGEFMPRVAQTATNIDRQTYNWAADNLDKIRDAEDMYGQVGIYEDLSGKIMDSHTAMKKQHGEQIGEALQEMNFRMDADEVMEPLRKVLNKYQDNAAKAIEREGEAALDKIDVENAQYLENIFNKYSRTGNIEGREAQVLLDQLNDLTGVRKSTAPGKMEAVDRELQNAAKQATKILDDAISLDSPALKEAKQKYKRDLAREKTLKKFFEDPEKTESTLNSLLSPKKNARRKKLMQISNEVGVPIDESAREAIATSVFANPSKEVLSIGGRTSTGVKLPAEAMGAVLGYGAASQLGDGHGSGVAGAFIGRALGARAFSPATTRRMMEMNARGKAFNEGIQNLTPAYLPNVYQTVPQVWQNLEQNRR